MKTELKEHYHSSQHKQAAFPHKTPGGIHHNQRDERYKHSDQEGSARKKIEERCHMVKSKKVKESIPFGWLNQVFSDSRSNCAAFKGVRSFLNPSHV